ncbi:MAG: acyl-CoA desaturase [Microbacterium sp.]|nr:acyl-CoA desaturase [Microbacterium sp.]
MRGPVTWHSAIGIRRWLHRPTRSRSKTGRNISSTVESRLGPIRQTYARTEDFPPIARAYTDISQVVRESGLLQRTRWFYILVGAALTLAFAGCVAGFILLGDSWFQLLIAGALGILFTQVAFLAHEAAHRQILSSGPANDKLALILGNGVVGMSYSWWSTKHTRHHSNPNRVGKDPDIDVDTISFLDTDAAEARGLRRAITRRQGWLFFPLLTLEGLNLHALAFRHVVRRDPVKDRTWEIVLLLARFALIWTPVFVFLPLGMAFAFLGVQLAVFGVYMGASFAPNHKGMPVIAADARLDFFSKQVRTSRNVSGGWWATWLMGGLNYQVEHHLFPNMPRPHLSRARSIVREHCRTLDVPYTETTLWRSYGIVIAYLNRVGLAARDPFDCPVSATYRRV